MTVNQYIDREDIKRVFTEWLLIAARPTTCRLTLDRQDLIRWRLQLGYTADDLVLLLRYARESDDPGPRWWRGDNPNGRRYLDLRNLLRRSKLADRVDAARAWEARRTEQVSESAGRFRLVSADEVAPAAPPALVVVVADRRRRPDRGSLDLFAPRPGDA
jgi:hypothetical protein